jgi:hypothetical protein
MEVGVDPDGYARPDADPTPGVYDTRGLAGRFQLYENACGDRLGELGCGLAWSGETNLRRQDSSVQSSPHFQGGRDIEPVDEPRKVLNHRRHGVRLYGVAQMNTGGQNCTEDLYPACKKAPLIREEGRTSDPIGELFDSYASDCQRAPYQVEGCDGRMDCHERVSARRSARSNLPLGDFGRDSRTTTVDGSM